MDGQKDGWLDNECMGLRDGGRMDGQEHGWVGLRDGWMNGWAKR